MRLAWPLLRVTRSGGAAERLGRARPHLFGCQLFFMRRDRPGEAEWILDLAVAISPELVGEREGDLATRRHRFLKRGVGVWNVTVQHDVPISLRDWRRAEFRKMIGQHEHAIADLDRGVHQVPARSARPAG